MRFRGAVVAYKKKAAFPDGAFAGGHSARMCEIAGVACECGRRRPCRQKYESAWKYGVGLACEFDDLREATRARVGLRTSCFVRYFVNKPTMYKQKDIRQYCKRHRRNYCKAKTSWEIGVYGLFVP